MHPEFNPSDFKFVTSQNQPASKKRSVENLVKQNGKLAGRKVAPQAKKLRTCVEEEPKIPMSRLDHLVQSQKKIHTPATDWWGLLPHPKEALSLQTTPPAGASKFTALAAILDSNQSSLQSAPTSAWTLMSSSLSPSSTPVQETHTEPTSIDSDWWDQIPDVDRKDNEKDLFNIEDLFREKPSKSLKEAVARQQLRIATILEELKVQYGIVGAEESNILEMSETNIEKASSLLSALLLRTTFEQLLQKFVGSSQKSLKMSTASKHVFSDRYESLGGREKNSDSAIANFSKAKLHLRELIQSFSATKKTIVLPDIIDLYKILLHHEIPLLKDTIDPATCFTRVETACGGTSQGYIPPSGIDQAMQDFAEFYRKGINGLNKITNRDKIFEIKVRIFAILSYSYLVSIHPFYNGNGRMAQLLMDYVTGIFGLESIALPKCAGAAVYVDTESEIEEILAQGSETLGFLIGDTFS